MQIATLDGAFVAEYSYDPWGRMRNPVNQQVYAVGSEPSLFLGRGFTGHEHLQMFGLVNMNARLYDPVLGRFLSPDPYIQDPELTQNYNRYSYCLNNPLIYIDPSGLTWGIFKPFVKAAKWVGNNIGSVLTATYLAASAVVTVFNPPLGLAMIGAYIGGSQANGWEMNAGQWNWGDAMTYCGIIMGAVTGYTAGYGLTYPGSVNLSLKVGIAGIADIGISLGGNDFNLDWSTSAGGGGSTNLNGHNTPSPEQVVDRAIGNIRTTANSNFAAESYIISPDGTRYDIVPYYGPKYVGGMAPIPGLAKGVKIVQYGGHTLAKETLKTLNLTKGQGKFAIESMKKANRLPPNFHGNIGSDGSFWSKAGVYIDNILEYIY